MRIYDFIVQDKDGKKVSLSEYKGKTVLIINTATTCGFTPQYATLQNLYNSYQDKGFVILDFPCDQFGHQASGSESEIHQFCTSRFGVKFPMFHKVEVNGENEEPLFKYLKSQKGFKGFDMSYTLAQAIAFQLKMKDPDYEKNADIKWNFTKFLIDKNGTVVERYEPTDSLEKLEDDIKEIL